MLGVELVTDQKTREPALALGDAVADRFVSETGVFIRPVYNVLIISPPLTITKAECDQVIEAFWSFLERCEPDGTIRDPESAGQVA
jgi:adenosylmethionine-8-amino-7-oxononanoate aminotransferase